MNDELAAIVTGELGPEVLLVERVRRGDEQAFRQLIKLYERRVFNFIRGMTRNNEDAEDLVQEAFVKAYFNIKSLKSSSSFKSWLFRIAYNLALDFIRKKRPNIIDVEDNLRESFIGSGNPKAELSREHLRRNVKKCMNLLNEQQKSILSLCDLEGMSYQEIAETLGIPFGTVQSRIFYARKKLKELLESAGMNEGDVLA